MPTFTYKDVRMVLAEADPVFATNVIDAMTSRGIRDPIVCRSAQALKDSMGLMVDLILCDVDLPGLDFCQTVQDIRQGRLGKNPFVVLIATARPSSNADLASVLASGIDYIVLKPMTADLVVRRVDTFTRGRKPFVVTETFIGPTRRSKRREDGSDDDLTVVPNTLRTKVIFNDQMPPMSRLLDVGATRMGRKRTETRLKSIWRLTRRLLRQLKPSADGKQPATMSGSTSDDWKRTLTLLAEKSDEVISEHRGAAATDHVAGLAARIAHLTKRLAESPTRPPDVEVVLVAQLADALKAAVAEEADVPEMAREITSVVDRFLARSAGSDEPEAEEEQP